jgi:hypothetical protein
MTQVGFGDVVAAADALGDVVAGELDVDTDDRGPLAATVSTKDGSA